MKRRNCIRIPIFPETNLCHTRESQWANERDMAKKFPYYIEFFNVHILITENDTLAILPLARSDKMSGTATLKYKAALSLEQKNELLHTLSQTKPFVITQIDNVCVGILQTSIIKANKRIKQREEAKASLQGSVSDPDAKPEIR